MKSFKEILNEVKGVKVPKFKTSAEMLKFLSSLSGSDKVLDTVYDPDTGEVYMSKGQNKKQAARQHSTMEPHNLNKVKVKNTGGRDDFTKDFDEIYQWVEQPISKITGTKVADYDTSLRIASMISRKDGKKIDQDDIDEIEMWFEDKYDFLDSEGFEASISKKGNRAVVSISFI
jgi:hypothetical protein